MPTQTFAKTNMTAAQEIKELAM
jgi:hypothetical protein